jgi:hypothetical protein
MPAALKFEKGQRFGRLEIIDRNTLYSRIFKFNWDIKSALLTPARKKNDKKDNSK